MKTENYHIHGRQTDKRVPYIHTENYHIIQI